VSITTTPTKPSVFVLAEIIYFIVADSHYSGSARL
jgi:hypothetical protein